MSSKKKPVKSKSNKTVTKKNLPSTDLAKLDSKHDVIDVNTLIGGYILDVNTLIYLAERDFISKNELRERLGFGPEVVIEVSEEKEVIDSRRLLDGSCETLFSDGSRIIVPPTPVIVRGFSDLRSPWETIDFSSPIVPIDEDNQPQVIDSSQISLFEDADTSPATSEETTPGLFSTFSKD